MTRSARTVAIAGMAAALWALVPGATASAHAGLESSDPAAGAVVASPPAQVSMIFTEPPDPALSKVDVLNTAGSSVASGEAQPGDAPRSLTIALPANLADGVYTVSWQVVSEADGHLTAGAFAFGVGVDPASAPAPTIETATSPDPSPLAIAGKIMLYVGIVAAIGTAVTGLWIIGPDLPGRRWLCIVAGSAAVIGAGAMFVAERSTLEVSFGDLLGSSTGTSYLALLGAASVLLICVLVAAFTTTRLPLVVMGLAGAAAAIVRAMGGHAAAASPALPQELAQSIHIMAVGVWIGGFVPILILLRARRRRGGDPPVAEVKRYSRAAGWAVLVVVLTGIARTIGEAGGVGVARENLGDLLFDTAYGTTLLVKVAIAVVVIGLGAFNRYRSIPRLSSGERMLGRVMSIEVVGAAAVLSATALLTSLSPQLPTAAAPPVAPAGVSAEGADFATTIRVELTATPGTPGPNEFRVEVVDYDTGEPAPADAVSLEFEPLGRPGVGTSGMDLRAGEPGVWLGEGTELSLAGVWNIAALVQSGSRGIDVALTLVTAMPGGQEISVVSQQGLPDIVTITLEEGTQLQSYVDPGDPGTNEVHVTAFDATGAELALDDLVLVVTHAGADPADAADPRVLNPTRLTAGHFSAPADLQTGDWRFDIVAVDEDGAVLQASFDQTIEQE
jgi:copper transport protein